MRYVCALVALLALSAVAPAAKAQVEIFGGYSYARPSFNYTETLGDVTCPITGCPTVTTTAHPNLNGWELSGAYNHRWLGFAADFSGHYGSIHNASAHLYTYLFGPEVRLPGPVSPFAHVLVGGAHESIGTGSTVGFEINSSSSNSFAAAVGAGIDVKLAPIVSLRAIQIDYLLTRFGSGTQSQPRASAGFVLHF